MTEKKRLGRPPKAEGEARTEKIEIRVTLEEKGELQEKAAGTGQTVSDWIRAKCLDSPNETG